MGDRKGCQGIEFLDEGDTCVPACRYSTYDSSYMERFRTLSGLDRLLSGTGSDYEKAKVITDWVHSQ